MTVVLTLTMTRDEYINVVLPLKNKLFAYSLKFVQSRQEAEDVVQDVMLKVWENRNSQKDITNMEAWCMTMVRNRSLDRLKLKSRRDQQIEERHDIGSGDASPLKVVEMKDLKWKLRQFIETLPLRQKEVILLRDYQEKTYQEIAEIMEIDINLVKVSIHRARKAIKDKILKLTAYGVESSKYQ